LTCPLCHGTDCSPYISHETGEYFQCGECALIFVDPSFRLKSDEEKARYDLHTNSPDDPGYRNYLKKVLDPVLERLCPGAKGLDFGSGPGPTLSLMFEEAGFDMRIYDHFYARDESALNEQYDFITSTEVIEHLYDPRSVLQMLWRLLKRSGILTLLTQPCPESKEAFASWYYKNDPTHVCFFSLETMQWLASQLEAELDVVGKDLFILRKTA
jgi:hypothetical protein